MGQQVALSCPTLHLQCFYFNHELLFTFFKNVVPVYMHLFWGPISSQKHAVRWNGYSKLPVNMNLVAWWPEADKWKFTPGWILALFGFGSGCMDCEQKMNERFLDTDLNMLEKCIWIKVSSCFKKKCSEVKRYISQIHYRVNTVWGQITKCYWFSLIFLKVANKSGIDWRSKQDRLQEI